MSEFNNFESMCDSVFDVDMNNLKYINKAKMERRLSKIFMKTFSINKEYGTRAFALGDKDYDDIVGYFPSDVRETIPFKFKHKGIIYMRVRS